MTTKTITSSNLRLEVCPKAGASIVHFEFAKNNKWLSIMRPTPPEAVADLSTDDMASFVLAPYSNRIKDAKFWFQGKEYLLRPNFPDGTAIHGDVWKRTWNLIEESSNSLVFSISSNDFDDFNFPFPIRAELSYRLFDCEFISTIELVNTGSYPMPAGFGFHPYFQRTLADPDEQVHLQASVKGVYPGETPIPTGLPIPVMPSHDFSSLRPVDEPGLDHCFFGWNGWVTIFWPGSDVTLKMACDEVFGHLVVYTPHGESFFAVEPVSHCNDGFNLAARGQAGTGVKLLQPVEKLEGNCRMKLV